MDKALNDQQDNGQDEKAKQQAKTAYAKTDFVPGDEIIFEDNLENEQLGEFPSQWDLMEGYAETGEADIKPESMVEITRIAKLMEENPGLEFEVRGHCDATGSDKVNDPLSQKRAEAIVDALAEQGIARSRLTPVGKGSHNPIASNSTDEGRAKNRRVEFVKK